MDRCHRVRPGTRGTAAGVVSGAVGVGGCWSHRWSLVPWAAQPNRCTACATATTTAVVATSASTTRSATSSRPRCCRGRRCRCARVGVRRPSCGVAAAGCAGVDTCDVVGVVGAVDAVAAAWAVGSPSGRVVRAWVEVVGATSGTSRVREPDAFGRTMVTLLMTLLRPFARGARGCQLGGCGRRSRLVLDGAGRCWTVLVVRGSGSGSATSGQVSNRSLEGDAPFWRRGRGARTGRRAGGDLVGGSGSEQAGQHLLAE